MNMRENEKNTDHMRLNAKELSVVAKMLELLQNMIEIVYHLMEHENQGAFVLILMRADEIDLDAVLKREKRDTDVLLEIDKEASLYVMLCQDTKVDGGYRFAQRILDVVVANKGSNVYCSELEIRTTHYAPKVILLKLHEMFKKSQQSKCVNEIVFRSLQ